MVFTSLHVIIFYCHKKIIWFLLVYIKDLGILIWFLF